jgi:RNase P subunit RPR2
METVKTTRVICDRCGKEVANGEKVYTLILDEIKWGTDLKMREEIRAEVCQQCAEHIAAVAGKEE